MLNFLKSSAASRRRRRGVRVGGGRIGGGGRGCCRLPLRTHLVRLWRRSRRLQFRKHRVRVGGRGGGRGEVAGSLDHCHRHGGRLVFGEGVVDGEVVVGGAHRDRAGRFAARSERSLGVGARRLRLKLHLDGRRCRFEIVADGGTEGGGRAAAKARCRKGTRPGQGNRDNTPHFVDPSLSAATRRNPRLDHRRVNIAAQPRGASWLIDG